MAYTQRAELETPSYGGTNTAEQFSVISKNGKNQSPRQQNAYQDEDGDISKRPGTIPITTSALAADIKYLTAYKVSPSATSGDDIYASSGTTLYKFNGVNALTAQTMTNALVTSDIHTIGFTNSAIVSRLLIADTGSLKQSNGTAVTAVTPAADDAAPAPANGLATINILGNKFIWNFTGHVFVSPGSDTIYYSKSFIFDYFPVTYYFQLEIDNDFVNGDGVEFDSVCLVPMRRHWAIITGTNFTNYDASSFLNTEYGVIAPRSIAKITYPDGTQSVPYLSDNGVHEIFIVSSIGGSRQYSTRNLMQGKIDFVALGLTDAEKAAAVGVFHPEQFLYLLSFQKAGVDYTYAYDTRNREWYTDWLTFNSKSYLSLNGTLYFAGTAKHLQKFDNTLYTDWNESTKTTGTAVYFKRYSAANYFEFSGFSSMWDAYLVEMKQWRVPSSLDITIIFSDIIDVMPSAILNEIFVEGVSRWKYARYANNAYTDLVQEPNELLFDFSRLSKYTQTLWGNNRDEPVKIFKNKWKGRISGK
jgi:hypothetical protein